MSGTTWAPHELDECEFVVLDALCKDKEVSGNDPEFLAYLAMKGETVEGLAQKLQGKRLAALDGGKFTLLTKKLLIGFAGDKCLAADDHAGRFSLWMERWIAERASSVR